MKLIAAVTLLRLLPSRKDNAITAAQILERWREKTDSQVVIRTVERYLSELSADGADGPALIDVCGPERGRRYYLRLSQVAQWFMTESSALDLLLARQVVARSFPKLGDEIESEQAADAAKVLADRSAPMRRLLDRLRVVPDGIGRLRATIDDQILASAIDAIESGQMLGFTYVKPDGSLSEHLRSPLGLVAKDGTIYLLAATGLSDPPVHFALQRVKAAHVVPQFAQRRPDFDLDRYIDDSHQLSHKLDQTAEPLQLKLRVAPQAMFHFLERPLAGDQSIEPAKAPDGWQVVTATVPETILLVPFLAGMGPWIELLEPLALRAKLAGWLHESGSHYSVKQDAGPRASSIRRPDTSLAQTQGKKALQATT